jgi:hypothetical protein
MSTQTGGAGETIQAQVPNIQQESQFQANIRPVAEPQQQAEMPAPVEQQAPKIEAEPQASLEMPAIELSEEDKIYQDYGLSNIDIAIPNEIYGASPAMEDVSKEAFKPIVTDDGFEIADSKSFESYIAPPVIEEQEDEAAFIGKSDDGFDVYNGKGFIQEQNNKLSSEYDGTGIKVDPSGAVKVVDPIKEYPVYKLPKSDVNYQKREDGWYKETGGKYVKLTKGDVAQRSAYLDKNAVVSSTPVGKGNIEVSKSASTITSLFGDPRRVEDKSLITAGGDPTLTDGLSFSALTRSNIGSKSEPLNQDGTKNFNYDPSTEVKNDFINNNPVNSRPDGVYIFPGSKSEFAKRDGEWLVKPAGSSLYEPLREGNIQERIENLEKRAVKKSTILETVTMKPYDVFNYSEKTKKMLNPDFLVDPAQAVMSVDEAKNFASKEIETLIGDKLNQSQKDDLKGLQGKINEVLKQDDLSDLQKGVAVSDIMKRTQQYFESAKQINKEINTAINEGVSLQRVAFDHKKKIADGMLVEGGSPNSTFQSFTKEMFDASSDMADFFMSNLDEGKIRFDSKSKQYVISDMISDREKNFIESKLASYNETYNKLQDERYVDVNNEIIRYKKNLSTVDSNIGRLEQSLKAMTKSGVPMNDPARIAISKQIEKEKLNKEYIGNLVKDAENTKSAVFLTEPKKVAANAAKNLSTDAATILDAVPKDLAPKDRFDLFYKGLYEETLRMMRDNGIGQGYFDAAHIALKDLLDWDGFYELNDTEKRIAKNVGTLRSLSPLYFNNDTGITESSAGFFDSFMNSFAQALVPTIAKSDGWRTQTEMASSNLEIITQELGMKPDDFVDERFLDKLEKRAINEEWNMEKWGGMSGSSMGIMVPLIATAGVGPGALRLLANLEKITALGLGAKETTGIINGAVKVYDTILDASKIGKVLKPALESGARFEIAGRLSNQDELYFLSGLAGGVASETLGAVFASMPKDQVLGYLSSVFGSQTSRAVNYIKRVGDMAAKGTAETGEEFAQELANIYRDTDSFKEMMAELSTKFGTFDKVQEFVISSFMLGFGFSIAEGTAGKKAYNQLPGRSKEQTSKALAEITAIKNQASSAANEYIENKKAESEIYWKQRQDDTKDESRVSGEVREGEESLEAQPVTEAGQEEAGTSGVVQEDKVTAMSVEEAKALWDQGYRPVVDGKTVKGGKDLAISNLFNTKKQIDMVRPTATPEAQAEAKPAESGETIDVFHGGSLDEKTGDLYVTEDMGQATEYAKGNDGDVMKYSISKEKVASDEDIQGAMAELGIEANEEAKLFELIDPRFEDTYIGDENKQKLFDSLKDKGFEAASFIDEDVSLSEKAGVRNIVVFDAENLSPSSVTVKENQADNLYDQGYRPVIDGKTQADYDKENLGDLFEQSERIEMAKPTETTAEAGTEQKGLTEKERFSQNLSLSELDALRTSIRNRFPDSYTIEVLDNVAESMRTGESNLPFELDYLSDGITLNDVQGILAQDEVFETGREVKNFLRERAISGDFLKAKDETRAEGVKERAYEKLAEKIRSAKIKPGDLTGGDTGIAMSSLGAKGFEKAWNAAMEAIAQTVLISGNSAEAIQKAIDAGFKALKESEWYKSLDKDQKKQAAADYNEGVNKILPKQRVSKAEREAAKEFKEDVAKATGTAKDEKTVQMTELQAIKEQLKNKALGAKDLQKVKDQAKKFVVDNLPSGKDFEYTATDVKSAVRAVSMARNPESLQKAIEKVEALIDKKYQAIDKKAEAKRKQTVKKIESLATSKRSTLSKRGNRWVGKVTTAAQKEFKDFVNSGALDNLDNRTQQELDAVLDVMNGILGEGRADQKNKEAIENSLKRQRAAKVLEGLAAAEDKVTLNSQEEIEEWLDKGNLVVINGELFRKSNFSELKNKRDAVQKKIDKKIKDAESAQALLSDPEFIKDTVEAELIDAEIALIQSEEQSLQSALASIPGGKGIGYKQRPLSLVKEAEKQRAAAWYKSPSGVIKALNPVNAINDIYSLLKSAYSGNSEVAKFIKQNLEVPIQKAYFERLKGTSQKISDLNKLRKDVFGSRSKAVNFLSSVPDVNVYTDRAGNKVIPTNSHFADWYNLVRTNSNGTERMEKSGVDPQKLIDYVESNPQLKAYADGLLNKYNTDLRSEYEQVFESYTNQTFKEDTYYPSYAADFRQEFVSEDNVMGVEGMYNAMNATSKNLKQRVNYSGPFDLSLDADAKYLDYIKTMEHAKHFLPIAKSANELFSRANSPYLVENMGADKFNELKKHLGIIVSDKPLEEYRGDFSKWLNRVRRFSTVAQLGGKFSSIPKQFTSFTHYWVAGIDRGIDPAQVILGFVPTNIDELKFIGQILGSDYVIDRLKGGSLDVELKAINEQIKKGNIGKGWAIATEIMMAPTKLGDISVAIGPGGGHSFALAIYRKNLRDGMSREEAFDNAYEAFATETERAQQSSREDITSMLQRDPNFRMLVQYRTGQMAVTKKIVNGVKTLNQASLIQNKEGVEARRSAISDRDIIQSIADIAYYSTIGNVLFNIVASGSLYFWVAGSDEDEKKRIKYDTAMDQIQSLSQGLGVPGFVVDRLLATARGDEWKNNIPVLSYLDRSRKGLDDLLDASSREWLEVPGSKKDEYLETGSIKVDRSPSREEFDKFMQEYQDAFVWEKMTDSEIDKIVKVLGQGNIAEFVKDMGDYSEGEQEFIQAFMNYSESYFEKAEEGGKKDNIFEFIYGEPYLPKKPGGKVKGGLPFPEEMKPEMQEEIQPAIK